MALGYEGYVKIDGKYALGTGTSVPNPRNRIESQSAYGGKPSSPVAEIAIGYPRNYDWSLIDGSLSFELTLKLLKDVLKAWVFDRQAVKEIYFSSRGGNVQQYSECMWTGISISASEGSAMDGQLSFITIERDSYTYGDEYPDTVKGEEFFADSGSGFPKPLNAKDTVLNNINPIPFWKSLLNADGTDMKFVDWSLSFSQNVTPFFTCEANVNPIEPKYLAVDVMNVVFSGSYMMNAPLANDIALMKLTIDDATNGFVLKMKKLERNVSSDDVQNGDALVPISDEWNVYELDSATT